MSYLKTNRFESSHKIGDYVTVNLNSTPLFGVISSVKFSDEGRVSYDIKVGDYKLYDLPSMVVGSMASHVQNIAKSELSNV